MLIRKLILAAIVLVSLTGCKKTSPANEAQIILFQVEYVNYAWGYQHTGFIIDNTGSVYTYNNPDGWNFPVSDRELGNDEIAENLSKCTLSEYKVPVSELRKYSSYIKNISQSAVSGIKNAGNDMGTLEYTCYLASPVSGQHRGYLIKMEGDFTCENLNFYSKKITSWLDGISKDIDSTN
jgi:hypothetical protein